MVLYRIGVDMFTQCILLYADDDVLSETKVINRYQTKVYERNVFPYDNRFVREHYIYLYDR
jgi:hypothetical protein